MYEASIFTIFFNIDYKLCYNVYRKTSDDMKRKGFTLIELLAVIVILVIMALIATPIILNILGRVRKSAFLDSSYGILESGKFYYADMVLNDNVTEKTFLFDGETRPQLEYSGEIPKGGMLQVGITGEISLAIHNNEWCALKGKGEENIRMIKYKDGKCIIPDNAKDPVITLNGKSVIKLKQGNTYQEPGATAKTIDGGNLDYEISIELDGVKVETIDTSIVGKTYLITYQASNNGKTVTVTRTVYIVDSVGPKITFDPETITLKLNQVATYNFYEGVTITDESDGEIEVNENTVKITGELKLEVGTYEITYEASDSEGNTTTAKRTFILEGAEGPILNYSSMGTDDIWLSETTVTVVATDTFNITTFSYELVRDGVSLGETTVEVSGKSVSTEIKLKETGIYQIKLKGTNEYGGESTSISRDYQIDSSTPTLTTSIGYNLYPAEIYTLKNVTQSGNTFTTTSHDPIMDFTDIGKYEQMNGVAIHFVEPISRSMGVQVFYGYPHSEQASISKKVSEGATFVQFDIPQKDYSRLRLDIGAETGLTYKIGRIEVLSRSTSTTRNNVSLFVKGNARSGIDSYSFDGGVTWQKENFQYFSGNGEAKVMVKSNTGFISEMVPASVSVIDKSVYVASILNHSSTLYGVTRSGNTFTTTDGDPQMVYSSTSSYKKLKKARIYFAEPVTKNIYIQIFYAPFSEANSTRGTIHEGESYIELNFPGGTYSQLRFDIGAVAGLTYKLSKIELLYEG